MIQIPQVGFKRSINQSNVNSNFLADWLEAIVLFDEKEVAKNDVVDSLIEYQICPGDAQDLAHEIASAGWNELRQRKDWGGLPNSFTIATNRVEDETDWLDNPIRSFFLMLSLFRIFPDWAREHRDYVTQGNLFEEVVELICPALLPGWEVYRAGWSPTNTKDVSRIVGELCDRICVSGAVDLDEWHPGEGKDAGLDIVCYRSFPDRREALPVYFLQCASGKNWRDKVSAPNADQWQRLLNSAVKPSTGIVAPFIIDQRELRIQSLIGQTIVFDRLSPDYSSGLATLTSASGIGRVYGGDLIWILCRRQGLIFWIEGRLLPRRLRALCSDSCGQQDEHFLVWTGRGQCDADPCFQLLDTDSDLQEGAAYGFECCAAPSRAFRCGAAQPQK